MTAALDKLMFCQIIRAVEYPQAVTEESRLLKAAREVGA
jgi:hypothetical protein